MDAEIKRSFALASIVGLISFPCWVLSFRFADKVYPAIVTLSAKDAFFRGLLAACLTFVIILFVGKFRPPDSNS